VIHGDGILEVSREQLNIFQIF